jgi:hypothetical protein
MDGQVVQRRVQAAGRAGGGALQQPPALCGETARGVGLAGLAERANRPVEQPADALDRLLDLGYAASSGGSAGMPCRSM